MTKTFRNTCTLMWIMALIIGDMQPAYSQLVGTINRRVSRVSNFEFALFNDGMIWGPEGGSFPDPGYAHWPRGSNHLIALDAEGIAFLGKKEWPPYGFGCQLHDLSG